MVSLYIGCNPYSLFIIIFAQYGILNISSTKASERFVPFNVDHSQLYHSGISMHVGLSLIIICFYVVYYFINSCMLFLKKFPYSLQDAYNNIIIIILLLFTAINSRTLAHAIIRLNCMPIDHFDLPSPCCTLSNNCAAHHNKCMHIINTIMQLSAYIRVQ